MKEQAAVSQALNLPRLFPEKNCLMSVSLLGQLEPAGLCGGDFAGGSCRTVRSAPLSEMQQRFVHACPVLSLRDITACVPYRILHFLNCVSRAGRHRGDFSVQH
jgi:hypothetical protein